MGIQQDMFTFDRGRLGNQDEGNQIAAADRLLHDECRNRHGNRRFPGDRLGRMHRAARLQLRDQEKERASKAMAQQAARQAVSQDMLIDEYNDLINAHIAIFAGTSKAPSSLLGRIRTIRQQL